MEKWTCSSGWMRSSGLSSFIAVICLTLAIAGPVAAEGYWKLVDTQLVDGTKREGTWIRVLHHTPSLVDYEGLASGWGPKVYQATWAPPAETLIPDGPVLTEVTAKIVSVPPALNHNAGLNVGCGFEHFGIELGYSSGSGIEGARAEIVDRAPGTRSDKKIIKAPKQEFGDAEGRMLFNVSVNNGFDKLGATFVYQWVGGPPPKSGTGQTGLPPVPPPSGDEITNNTAWTVGHPVPWVFHPDGTIDAKGLWQGTWVREGNAYTVTIEHMGVKDTFTVQFSADGRSFTAFKDGEIYRRGVRH